MIRAKTRHEASSLPVRCARGRSDSPDIDVVVFESPAKAYRRIRCEKPVAVIVHLLFDSATEFLLLTMLKLDPETAAILIWTCADLRKARHIELLDFGEAGDLCCALSYFKR